MQVSNSKPELKFYVGSSDESRTRLLLSKSPITSKTVVVTTQLLGPSAFISRYSDFYEPKENSNVIKLFGAKDRRAAHVSNLQQVVNAIDSADSIVFERLDTRPADVTETLRIILTLSRLARVQGVTVLAGIFAASDSESLLLEQVLFDYGVEREKVIGCWLNGIQNNPVRYVRLPISALPDFSNTFSTSNLKTSSNVEEFKHKPSLKGFKL